MTTLDPSHIPIPFTKAHASRQQAILRPSQSTPLHLPAIPDLRFEQSYLRSIAPYVHTPSAAASLPQPSSDAHNTSEAIVTGKELRIDWLRVGWITTRDQVISPLLQGALWGVAGHFLRPFMSLMGYKIRSAFNLATDSPPPPRHITPKGDGQFIERLRAWSKSLAIGGIETNVALAK